jgi:multidrug efflux system outer membrane protein
VGLLAVALVLAGCAIGPNYRRPETASPDAFRGQEGPAEAASLADLPWWELFRDPVLQGLIQQALTDDYDLQSAAQRVEVARNLVGVERSPLFPQVGYEADAGRGKNAFLGTVSPGTGQGNAFLAALNASWEIDLWGRIRRSTEAARAELFASEAFRRGVWLSLVSNVAQAYFELRELDLELEIARSTVDSFENTRQLFERQYRGGVASRLAALRAEAAAAQAAASVPALEAQIVAKENELSVLLGRPPGPIPRGAALVDQSLPPEVPAGLPASLLERRPDLVESEQTLAAANARVGVAIAEFLPRIGLTALYGSVSPELHNLLEKGTNAWSVAAQAAGPIFQGGRLLYGYRAAKAQWEEARLQYQQNVLIALGEVSNALVARQKLAQQRDQDARAVAALQESVRLSTIRYLGGLASYIEVLDAQLQLFPAENALARAERDLLLTTVQLYKALGGGWWMDPASPSGPPAVPSPPAAPTNP